MIRWNLPIAPEVVKETPRQSFRRLGSFRAFLDSEKGSWNLDRYAFALKAFRFGIRVGEAKARRRPVLKEIQAVNADPLLVIPKGAAVRFLSEEETRAWEARREIERRYGDAT